MLTTIAVTIAGGHLMDALAPDYFDQALARMMHTVCCTGIAEESENKAITRQVMAANRLKPSRRVRHEFEGLVSSFRLPTAKLMFKPGEAWGSNPNFHTVVRDLIQEEGGSTYKNVFNWIYETPAARAAIEQAFELVLASLHRLEDHYMPHLRQALERHTFAPDFAFLTGLQAAGFELDLERNRWLESYGFKEMTEEGEFIY